MTQSGVAAPTHGEQPVEVHLVWVRVHTGGGFRENARTFKREYYILGMKWYSLTETLEEVTSKTEDWVFILRELHLKLL